MNVLRKKGVAAAVTVWIFGLLVTVTSGYADTMACNMSGYKAAAGLSAILANDTLAISWNGDTDQELRLSFGVTSGTPVMRELAIRRGEGVWTTLATNVTPEFRVTSGLRRISNQQLAPLRGLGVKLTDDIVDRFRWEPFWDAPLDLDRRLGVAAIRRRRKASPTHRVCRAKGGNQTGGRRVSGDRVRGPKQRWPTRSVVPGRDARCLHRRAAVHDLQGQQSHPAGASWRRRTNRGSPTSTTQG